MLWSPPMAADVISFARGAPSADILPADAVREAATKALADDWKRALSYGTGFGHPDLCAWVASELHGIDAAQVMFTNGSMEAAALLFRYMIEPGDRVIVEQPSYDRTLLLLGRSGAELVPVPLESDGLDVDAFEAALEGGPVKLAHVIPNFHNPAGCSLSAAKRERLVALAAEHGFWLFEDDPYRLISFGDEPPPTMLSQDSAGRVIHASSFSKTVSPGVRAGYLAGPAQEIATLAKRGSEHYISPNMLAESIVLELCRSGRLAENIEFVNGRSPSAAMRSSRRCVSGCPRPSSSSPAVATSSGSTCPRTTTRSPRSRPPPSRACPSLRVRDFLLEGGGSSLRLSFASVPADQIAEGVERLARALESVRAASPA